MKWPLKLALLVLCLTATRVTIAQTEKPLTNADVLTMTKQGFAPSLIVKAIQTSSTSFDVSAQALVELKNAGVDQSVMEAMLAAHGAKHSAAVEPEHGAASPLDAATSDPSKPACSPAGGCLLRDSTEVPLKFATDVNSKSAHEGDPVEFLLDEDIKVGDTVVVPKGAHAVATVSAAKKAGMMGRPGELNVQLQYLVVGTNHIHLRGTKGKEGDSKTGATVALTVIFGPIGLIKHGKNVDIPIGTPLKAYVDQDIWLPPTKLM
ncbi:MAG TPA: hypothetical protein VNU20_00745 [Candidatus Sulfotelmatobacter sp.]|jgi:hypothetical protein|nr:hypothetical protein [Candidatus Sulfotelmatobacter sp.]